MEQMSIIMAIKMSNITTQQKGDAMQELEMLQAENKRLKDEVENLKYELESVWESLAGEDL